MIGSSVWGQLILTPTTETFQQSHKLEEYLDAYLEAAGIREDRKGPLFRAALGRTGELSARPLSRTDVWYMVRAAAR